MQTPNHYAHELVYEFYTAMVPHWFSAGHLVIVQGLEVVITAERINSRFGTLDILDLVDRLPNHEYFTLLNGNLAADLWVVVVGGIQTRPRSGIYVQCGGWTLRPPMSRVGKKAYNEIARMRGGEIIIVASHIDDDDQDVDLDDVNAEEAADDDK
ncbi:hypothetical protein Dsin_013623 [Dipteronia sinensis]|uniref:Uncharacterized protein n=1 Tax=Dipteronia sinensis TaxID=43782 RepID=A0AAE0E921_9ROSI|nr:hypothetical protein Dsin_013623 [Dipteronia sinensis]